LVPFKEEIFPVLRRVKVSLSWTGKGNNSACLWVNDSRPGRVWSVTSRLGTGIWRNLFLQCRKRITKTTLLCFSFFQQKFLIQRLGNGECNWDQLTFYL
jgi:hypothetical protein